MDELSGTRDDVLVSFPSSVVAMCEEAQGSEALGCVDAGPRDDSVRKTCYAPATTASSYWFRIGNGVIDSTG